MVYSNNIENDEIQAIDAKFMKIREQEGGYTEGEDLEDTSSIEEELITTEWVTEAEQIPLDLVTPLEREYLLKCIHQEIKSIEDKEILKEILNKYRPAIQKIQPKQVVENYETNQVLVEDEKAFLDIVDEFDTVQVIPFTFKQGTKIVKMKFDLYPLSNSKSILDVTENLSMFKDLTEDELLVYNKSESGVQLTREEMIIQAGVQKKLTRATLSNTRDAAIEYLALQLKFHNKDSKPETMRAVFDKMSNEYLNVLFEEVQRRNLNGVDMEDVFQPFD